MRTEVIHDPAAGTPWLEHESRSGPAEKSPLQSFPYKVGRNDTADLCIDSGRVSREHAVITRHGKKYRVKDLGSTNGTFVNGQRIDEVQLNDGDQLVFAEEEFTFFCPAISPVRQTTTEVIENAQRPVRDTVWDTIFAIRRIHEVVTGHALATLFQPITEVASGDTFGYEAFATTGADDAGHPRCDQWVGRVECRAAERMRQLFRRVAAEEAVNLPGGRLFLAIAASEVAGQSLVSHLCQLRELVGANHQIVVEIPDNAVRKTADFREFLAQLRGAQFQVAYDGYATGKAQIVEHKEIAPDFLKLAPAVFKNIHRGHERQRQVELIVRACQDVGSTVIASGIDNNEDLSVCLEMGCKLAQGTPFGIPQPLSALIHSPGRTTHAGQLVS
jgi:EAL domain-containing protein (putative c-di-GMP-specific phosphodiesterase class I)